MHGQIWSARAIVASALGMVAIALGGCAHDSEPVEFERGAVTAGEYVPTTPEELHERIGVAHRRFASLASEVAPTLRAEAWTSREVVAHLVNVVNRYNEFAPGRLAAEPRGVDEINRREVDGLGDRSITDLLEDLAQEMAAFGHRWGPDAGLPLDLPLPFHGGGTIDLQSGLTNLIGEYLVHGLDLADAAGVEWPIDARDGALMCGFGTQILPAYVRRASEHDLLIHLDLDGVAPWALDINGPTAVARPPSTADMPDVTIAGPALPFALMAYGRIASADLASAGLDIGGRHPERAAQLTEVFEVP